MNDEDLEKQIKAELSGCAKRLQDAIDKQNAEFDALAKMVDELLDEDLRTEE